jgi:hypothetical protein
VTPGAVRSILSVPLHPWRDRDERIVTFGLWLPWVSASDGNAMTVRVIHERDQFLLGIAPQEFAMTHSIRAP